jgi:hypothetical protein
VADVPGGVLPDVPDGCVHPAAASRMTRAQKMIAMVLVRFMPDISYLRYKRIPNRDNIFSFLS